MQIRFPERINSTSFQKQTLEYRTREKLISGTVERCGAIFDVVISRSEAIQKAQLTKI